MLKGEASSIQHKEPMFIDFCGLSQQEMRRLPGASDGDRMKIQIPASKVTKEDILHLEHMTLLQHIACVAFLAVGVPNGIFTIPAILCAFGYFVVGSIQVTFLVFILFILPLIIMPQAFVPTVLQSWLAIAVSKYFSFRFITDEQLLPNQRRILVAPPHGVFPYGNLLAMICWPTVFGFPFRGLAASSALRVPGFKQILRSMGVTDASRHVARKVLEKGNSLGISTGGVAEVFETNAGDECIVLRERVGLVKLAIRTGADLVPCYLFGNTKVLSCWAGEGIPGGRYILEKVSRKIGFALILIFGRWGLPIPYRVPVLGVAGKSISTKHMQCEEPTAEQVKEIQEQLLKGMDDVFERNKKFYGWENKKLVIK